MGRGGWVGRKGACPRAGGVSPLTPPPTQFRYKTRVYKQTNLDEKQLAKLHTKVGGAAGHAPCSKATPPPLPSCVTALWTSPAHPLATPPGVGPHPLLHSHAPFPWPRPLYPGHAPSHS